MFASSLRVRALRILPCIQNAQPFLVHEYNRAGRPFPGSIAHSFRSRPLPRCMSHAMLSTSNMPDAKDARAAEVPFKLTPTEHRLIDLQREVLRQVLSVVEGIEEASERDVKLLRDEIERLGDGFFLLVVAGEYNSGKSSLINALAGKKVLDEGPTPTTAQVTKLKYADESVASQSGENGVLVLGEPISILSSRLQIVDTPGTNAIDRAHETLTRDYIPLCDLVLFVTSADRPFSESERLFLESIRQWGKKVVLVINKMDLLAMDSTATAEVVEFVTSGAKSLLGSKPFVFPVSARMALEAKQASTNANGDLWERGGLQPLENYMKETLDSKEKFKVKLEASSAVGTTILDKYNAFLRATQTVVEMDSRSLTEINNALERYEERVRKGFSAQYAKVDNALLHMLDRADIFFDTHIRISNVSNLLQKEKLRQDFENEVIANTTKVVQRQAEAMAEWLTDKSSRSISETTAIFARRMGERGIELQNISLDGAKSSIADSLTAESLTSHEMEWSRAEDSLISGLSAAASDLASSYDALNDGQRVAQTISASVRTALTLEASAVGLLGVLLGTSSLDVTGVTSTGILASAGLVVLPRRRITLRREVRSRMTTLRTRLQKDLENSVNEHVAAHVTRIRDAMGPFATFTLRKSQNIESHIKALGSSRESIGRVRKNILDAHIGTAR